MRFRMFQGSRCADACGHKTGDCVSVGIFLANKGAFEMVGMRVSLKCQGKISQVRTVARHMSISVTLEYSNEEFIFVSRRLLPL